VDTLFNFFLFNNRVKKIVNKIKPDVINLIGAENAYYASSIFQFKGEYPVVITIQGFISENLVQNRSKLNKYRSKIELNILRNFKNFIGETDSMNYIKKFNQDINFFKAYFPVNEELIEKMPDEPKIYDCIYFGRIDKLKGTEDFIKIIAQLKKSNENIRGIIVGIGEFNEFISLSKKLDCYNNITFKEFAKTQLELFQLVKQSKLAVVPTYFDRLPSTIREAMFLKVPVISYATGGIPYINNDIENIKLIRRGNYMEMANEIKNMLKDEKKLNVLAERGYNYARKEFSLSGNVNNMITAYLSTIGNN
jgi:glycosyltransferase involved in cell wall biosynthesis